MIEKIDYIGGTGANWSSTDVSTVAAHYLGFYDNTVRPSNYDHRYFGYSLRCVAR